MTEKKVALLDTDFISKMYIIQDGQGEHFIDKVVSLPGYEFYCHSHIVRELSRHSEGAYAWLEDKIRSKQIRCYSDENILSELEYIYGRSVCGAYFHLLKTACAAFDDDYLPLHYAALIGVDYKHIEKNEFLSVLDKTDGEIGRQNSLGEIKTFVLLQVLELFGHRELYVFCSDDRNARNGVVSIGAVNCISVLTSFMRLKEELALTKDDAEPFFQSWIDFCKKHNQVTFRVWEASDVPRLTKVPCRQVFDEIYEDRFEEIQTGWLKYRK